MGEMKSFQESIASKFVIPLQTISSFPSFWCYELSLKKLTKKNLLLGLALSYNSTGGRLYYSDYSGSEGSDQLINSFSGSLIVGGWKGFSGNRWQLHYEVRPGFTSSNLDFSVYEVLGGVSNNESVSFHSSNFFVQPLVGLTRRLGSFGINTSIGYNLSMAATKQSSSNGYLVNGQNEVHTDWSGLRLQGGLSYFID